MKNTGQSWNYSGVAPILEFLLITDPTETKSSGIAEKWEMAQDGLSWIFYLRKGVTWHDGSAVTAKDVKFSFERYKESGVRMTDIKNTMLSAEVVDDYTLRVYTLGADGKSNGPQAYFWRFASPQPGQVGKIMPKDYFEKGGAANFERHPIGSGPYKFVRHGLADFIEYEALPKHYRIVPTIKKITLLLLPEETTRIAMLKTGQVDIINISPDSVPDVESAGLRTTVMSSIYPLVSFYMVYDPRAKGSPLTDVRVRQALSLAINREELKNTFFYGKLQPPMPPMIWTDQPEIDVPFWREYSAKAYRYDPVEAKRLLTEAGYASGIPTFKLISTAGEGVPFNPRLAQVIQGYWSKIGAKAEIFPIEYASFQRMRQPYGAGKGMQVDIIGTAGMHQTDGGPIPIRSISSRFWSKATFDLYYGNDAARNEMDSYIDGAFNELDPKKRFELTAKAIKMATDSYLTLSIGGVPTLAALGPRVDITYPPQSYGMVAAVESAKLK